MAPPSRRFALLAGFWLVALSAIFTRVLIFNLSDNAYLWIAVLGFVLFMVAVPMVFAGALPDGMARSAIWGIGLVLFWLVAGLGALAMLYALAIIPSQGYPTNQVFLAHLIALLLLAPTIFVIGILSRRYK